MKTNVNLSVPWYLSAACAYYEHDEPFLTDSAFDWLARHMIKNWNVIKHRHKNMLTLDDLNAGTMLRRDWPGIVKGSTKSLIVEHRDANRKKR